MRSPSRSTVSEIGKAHASERTLSRVLSCGDHSSRPVVTGGLEQPPRSHRAGRTTPVWSCFRWGLPSLHCHQRSGALLPHPFTLTGVATGGLLSVALSCELPRLAVKQHPAL